MVEGQGRHAPETKCLNSGIHGQHTREHAERQRAVGEHAHVELAAGVDEPVLQRIGVQEAQLDLVRGERDAAAAELLVARAQGLDAVVRDT